MPRGRSARAARDEDLKPQIRQVFECNYRVYGARKVWLALNRDGVAMARCTVERLMHDMGLRGAHRGKVRRTTIPDPQGARARDLVLRQFNPPAPNRLWVADTTYVSTWSGFVYAAFVIDTYSRRIVGWRTATTMTSALVLDAIEHAIWTRQPDQRPVQDRTDQAPRPVAHHRPGRSLHPGMGGLVQPPPHQQLLRRHTTIRARSPLLRSVPNPEDH